VSVIKDDGTVVDITATTLAKSGAGNIAFTPDNEVIFTAQQSSTNTKFWLVVVGDIPETDLSAPYWISYTSNVLRVYAYGDYILSKPRLASGYFGNNDIKGLETGKFIGGNAGLTLLNEDVNPNDSMVNYITSDYNTGWMNGDIKLATLSDTDDTDLVGSEFFPSGDFTGWTSDDTNVLNVEADGTVTVNDGNGVVNTFLSSPTLPTEIGKTYVITITGVQNAGSGVGLYTLTTNGPNGYEWSRTFTFTANRTVEQVRLFRYRDYNGTGTITSISMKLVEPDRSVNNNGLQVFGTVRKNPVATGADLVAYSGFSPSNYLQQPYNSTISDIGTGDFCVMGWCYHDGTSSTGYMFAWDEDGIDTNNVIRALPTLGNSAAFFRVGSASMSPTDVVATPNSWDMFCFVRRNGVLYIYKNGVPSTTTAVSTDSISSTTHSSYVGQHYGGSSSYFRGSLALLRISGTAPTAEQIKKIYEDEKVLFQENAKATLHGTSDAVTALAYDEDTELLHVGTSSGRSEFQGLRRVSNTTDAVGTAISASNNLVVEE
jgi:hypothetical protein